MADATQSYGTHRRYFPLFHFFAIPLLVANLIIRIIYAWMHRGARLVWWEIVVALALLAVAFASRIMVLTVQDRLITLEETMRLQRCLPDDLRGRVGELSSGQLIALRFCGDDGAGRPDALRSRRQTERPQRDQEADQDVAAGHDAGVAAARHRRNRRHRQPGWRRRRTSA